MDADFGIHILFMHLLPYAGSTACFRLVAPGKVLKAPWNITEGDKSDEKTETLRNKIFVEQNIPDRLGRHPRIVPYLGPLAPGILLSEARHGNLQPFIDSHSTHMSTPQRWHLCKQIAEAVAYVHSKGVIHSDLRPENFLVHEVDQQHYAHIWLCDFGGSYCTEASLDGQGLPDLPFGDPRAKWEASPQTDIFSLGSLFYTVMAGHWPFLDGPPDWSSLEDKVAYWDRVEGLFKQKLFPDVSGLSGGKLMSGCWDGEYRTAEEVTQAVQQEIIPTEL